MAVETGDTISVEYTGTLDDGTVFDKSGEKPLTFKVGSGQIIPGFDKAVEGMELNETKKIHISVEDAYGKRNENLKTTVPRSQFPPDFKGKVGSVMLAQTPTGQKLMATIIKMDENEIVLDLNHPLAGKALNFEVKVVKIEK